MKKYYDSYALGKFGTICHASDKEVSNKEIEKEAS